MLLLPASHVAAQTRKETSLGYSFMRADGINLSAGWNVSFARGGGAMKGVVDLTGQHRKDDDGVLVFQGGVRFGPLRPGRVRQFGQALFGVASVGISATWIAQLGVGLDIPTRAGAPTLRLGLDLPVFFGDNGRFSGLRATAGIVVSR